MVISLPKQRFKKIKKRDGTIKLQINRYVWDNLSAQEQKDFKTVCIENNWELFIKKKRRGHTIDGSDEQYQQSNDEIKRKRAERHLRKVKSVVRNLPT